MLRKNSILAVLPIILAATNAFAWSWKDAVNQAKDRNPTLQAQRQNEQITHLRYQDAKSLRLPRLSIQGSLQEYENRNRDLEHRASIGPRMQWLLFQGGKVGSGIDRAELVEKQAEVAVDATNVATNFKLRQAFAQAIYAKSFLDLTHRIEKQRQDNVKLTEIQYQSGLEYKWVYLSSMVQWKKAQLDVTQAEMNKKTALVDLENVLGKLPIQSIEEISDVDFYSIDTEYSLDQTIEKSEKNPNIKIKELRIEEMEHGVDYVRADRYPGLGLQGDFGVMSMSNYGVFPFWAVTLGLSMPIFEGGRINRNIAVARAQLAQRSYELEQSKLDIKADVQRNYQTFFVNRQQLEISKLDVEASKDRAKVVANQYRSGVASFLDWERSQDGWVNAEIGLLSSIRNYQISRAKLEESMGLGLE